MADTTRPCDMCGKPVTGGPTVACGACGHHQAGVAMTKAKAREDAAFAISEAVAEWLKEDLPPSQERRDRMLRVLMGLAEAQGVPVESKDRIAAARVVLDQSPVDPAEELRRVFGDPRKALAFIRAAVPELEAEAAAQEAREGAGARAVVGGGRSDG